MAIIHIGIGSNLGDRESHCDRALEEMKARGIRITKVSSRYETEPWGMREQPNFINMAVEAETDLSPEGLLAALKEIERTVGRRTTFLWGPRVIDLDILFYDDAIIDGACLRIPHPLLHTRSFVLLPLAEIAPGKMHPVLRKTVGQLKEERKSDEDAERKEQI
ncbi:MAG: 2-amino-4-hydroxy-6-hydroxymethyldihydropteridine diphosphokinase [Alphaproteobacteria bacterium]|uniref:2-amino-4-hydroxy-6-hydroxymethyldihydropteridine pyrophosphokinase n=1 Tax=Candidatus Nitrobium versatile TaxID=2884831 RepID=A0A953M2B0_9BACT|nr:2-amino-4-hydroxy-6-hydroxymethyldihydropteridine diphosphokinase [Candidatus Nitrobium versatile]